MALMKMRMEHWTDPDRWEIHVSQDGTKELVVSEALWWGIHADKQKLALVASAEPILDNVARVLNEPFE
jgi:hypothetical protein